jgi:hypothetical protein
LRTRVKTSRSHHKRGSDPPPHDDPSPVETAKAEATLEQQWVPLLSAYAAAAAVVLSIPQTYALQLQLPLYTAPFPLLKVLSTRKQEPEEKRRQSSYCKRRRPTLKP